MCRLRSRNSPIDGVQILEREGKWAGGMCSKRPGWAKRIQNTYDVFMTSKQGA